MFDERKELRKKGKGLKTWDKSKTGRPKERGL